MNRIFIVVALVFVGYVLGFTSCGIQPSNNEISEQNKAREDSISMIRHIEDSIIAIGFDSLKVSSTVNIDYNKIVISKVNNQKEFRFGYYTEYNTYWTYKSCDRDCKYFTADLAVTSESKTPLLPEFAVYYIKDKEMLLVGKCAMEFANWTSHATSIGLYHDNNNDFAKVSTVKFKLGVQIPDSIVSKSYVLVARNENTSSRVSNGYDAPRYSRVYDFPKRITNYNFNKNEYLVLYKK